METASLQKKPLSSLCPISSTPLMKKLHIHSKVAYIHYENRKSAKKV